jgi:hypothetical protein
MPTVRAGRQVRQNEIRFKNLLRKAREQLTAADVRTQDVDPWLRPAEELSEKPQFWNNQSDGLALYAFNDHLDSFRLPVPFDELVVVAQAPHLKPLLSLLQADGRFYVLTLSKKQVRLFYGSRFALSEVDLEKVPQSLSEVLQHDVFQKQLQYHTGAPGRGDKRDAIRFGTGDRGVDEKEQILRFFRKLDRGIMGVLAQEQAPLVLASVDYLMPIYRKANHYKYLLPDGITGNPDEPVLTELHKRAWAIVEPFFVQNLKDAKETYAGAASQEKRTSSDLREVIRAAADGRVEILFVPVGVQRWGLIDSATGEIDIHDTMLTQDMDLMNLAAIYTLSKGGSVYVVSPQDMPDGEPIAALYRY